MAQTALTASGRDSPELTEARGLIVSVRGESLSPLERADRAVALAGVLLRAAERTRTSADAAQERRLSRLMDDPVGKVFTTALTDQCFRTGDSTRVADQLRYLVDEYGVPAFLRWWERLGLAALSRLAPWMPELLVPQLRGQLRRDTARVILPGEPPRLRAHLGKRRQDGVRTNVNHLGEAILGEQEAARRLDKYLAALGRDEIDYISVKLSTIGSQLSVRDFEGTISRVAPRLRRLYAAAAAHTPSKFINLDMEEFQDLELTLELFMRVLDEPEFRALSAGIVIQAYLPDAHGAYDRLAAWARARVAGGGAPIKMRVVKGANLAMERVHSALHHWPQAPYPSKAQVDASFKRLLDTACQPENAAAVRVGVASHNLFDIAWALLLRAERGLEEVVGFEMLEGMADPMRRVVQAVSGSMLLYCPAAADADFASAIAYLVRRLDENTAPENFLRHAFGLLPGTERFNEQAALFRNACRAAPRVSTTSRRHQDRRDAASRRALAEPYVGEPSTDWTSAANREWIRGHLDRLEAQNLPDVHLAIGGRTDVSTPDVEIGRDPSHPTDARYRYSQADWLLVDEALDHAVSARAPWAATSVRDRAQRLLDTAAVLRTRRGDLLAALVLDGGKTVEEADPELCEAIDFLEYYARSAIRWFSEPGIRCEPLGTVLITPPWNFPLAIPLGGVAAALVMGNTVLLKPAPETVWLGRLIAEAFWAGGVATEVLQFLVCPDTPVGSRLIADPRVSAVILTGATSTAELFLGLRPGLHLMAETGGKNAIVLTRLSDRDLAVGDIVQSAFGHSGQKCSAASLLICEREVYEDPEFRRQLVDAAESLIVGSAWSPSTRVGPLIGPPGEVLASALTTLDAGEQWWLQPRPLDDSQHLWSPGIKAGVLPGSRSHQTEFFGPVLSVMCAENLDHALDIANDTPYGLTSGLHSLDPREVSSWLERIEAGNLYVNRGITGAIVERQPFGGCKASGFGRGAKAGGPNYVSQLVHILDGAVDTLPGTVPRDEVRRAVARLPHGLLTEGELSWLERAAANDALVVEKHVNTGHDPSRIVGQDNRLEYRPRRGVVVRAGAMDSTAVLIRTVLAAIAVGVPLHVVVEPESHDALADWLRAHTDRFEVATDHALAATLGAGGTHRFVRCFRPPSEALLRSVIGTPTRLVVGPCVASGRVELLYLVREVSISIDYHRYGNLGLREGESRQGPVRLPADPVNT